MILIHSRLFKYSSTLNVFYFHYVNFTLETVKLKNNVIIKNDLTYECFTKR